MVTSLATGPHISILRVQRGVVFKSFWHILDNREAKDICHRVRVKCWGMRSQVQWNKSRSVGTCAEHVADQEVFWVHNQARKNKFYLICDSLALTCVPCNRDFVCFSLTPPAQLEVFQLYAWICEHLFAVWAPKSSTCQHKTDPKCLRYTYKRDWPWLTLGSADSLSLLQTELWTFPVPRGDGDIVWGSQTTLLRCCFTHCRISYRTSPAEITMLLLVVEMRGAH